MIRSCNFYMVNQDRRREQKHGRCPAPDEGSSAKLGKRTCLPHEMTGTKRNSKTHHQILCNLSGGESFFLTTDLKIDANQSTWQRQTKQTLGTTEPQRTLTCALALDMTNAQIFARMPLQLFHATCKSPAAGDKGNVSMMQCDSSFKIPVGISV